jgi:thiamine transport system permease protein
VILVAAPVVFETVMIYFPFAFALVGYAGQTFVQTLINTATDPLVLHSFQQSLIQGALSSAAALLVGYPVGLILGLYSFRGSALYRSTVFLPFMIPSIVAVVGFEQAFGTLPQLSFLAHSLSGIIAVNTFYNAPLVALLVASSIERLNTEMLWAARVSGSTRLKIFKKVLAPLTGSSAASGTALTFVYSYLAFLVPLAIGGPSYYTSEVEVYVFLKSFFEPSSAVVLALLQLGAPLLVSYLLIRFRKEAFSFGRLSSRAAPYKLKVEPKNTVPLLALTCFLMFEVYPLVSLVKNAFFGSSPLLGFKQLLKASSAGALHIPVFHVVLNSLVYSVLTVGLTLAFSLMATHRSLGSGLTNRAYEFFLFAPIAFSPVTIGVSAYLTYYNAPLLNLVWPLIVMAQTAVAMPLALRFTVEGLKKTPVDAVWAARTAGASVAETFFRVEVPLSYRAVASAAVIAFGASLGEFAATTVVYTPNYTTMPLAIYALLSLRLLPAASALSTVLLALALLVYYALFRLGGENGSQS